MYIKSMILDGFKSYGQRIEINGFDKEFNAITGFNGSGKSNILDGICFVLGIANLGQVRVTSLQDLVYKSGQAGIKKATVTIIFNNSDRKSSPLGYEHHEEITITRQVIIGRKNKYMINGLNVQNKRVQELFCSVQLNVNNPHFLIMQGRITKVLNMKPIEILSMIEEAAGTRMYETKKNEALNMIQKKDAKLKEINDILKEDIEPKLKKLKEERRQYMEFQRIEREVEHYKRINIAWKYVMALRVSKAAQDNLQSIENEIENKIQTTSTNEERMKSIEQELVLMSNKETKGELQGLEEELQDAEKKQVKLVAKYKSAQENIKAAMNNISQLKTNIDDEEKVLNAKEKEFQNVEGLFTKLKEQDQNDAQALLAAQEKYQKINSGHLVSEDGEKDTFEQLIGIKEIITRSQTEFKQSEMSLKHNKEQLKIKEKNCKTTEHEYEKDSEDVKRREKELKDMENQLKKFNYEEGTLENLHAEKQNLNKESRPLREKLEQFESQHPQIKFEYRDPTPNFNRDSVKGVVCKLLNLKNRETAYALEVAAGGKLYNVIVDTAQTGTKILKYGQLQKRVTIIPLNKVTGRAMDRELIDLARNLVGEENVQPALSLIDYPDEFKPVMNWMFGQIFVCRNMESAKKIAFDKRIMKKCVTYEGDVVDPMGTLSGGAAPKSGSLLLMLDQLKDIETTLIKMDSALSDLEKRLRSVNQVAEGYTILKQKYDLKRYEIDMVIQKLQQTTHGRIKDEIEQLKSTIEELNGKMINAKETEENNTKHANELESRLKNATNIREQQLAETEYQLEVLRTKSENSRKQWEKHQRGSNTLEIEIKELKNTIEKEKQYLSEVEEEFNNLQKNTNELEEHLKQAKIVVDDLQENLSQRKELINRHNKEMQKLAKTKDDIIKENLDIQLDIKKLNHKINGIKNNAKDSEHKLNELSKRHEWIEQDKDYFGKPGGIYDFDVNKPDEIEEKLSTLQKHYDKLSRNINSRAVLLLDKEEEHFNETLRRKRIVENDKKHILESIKCLDTKKKEILFKACEDVNKQFGSIFSTLLPGANAKLQPLENQTVLNGLEVKVGFSNVWKESLGELSGGQRSLVALSLILAMLLFKPAPLYILDEVDAALDLSHTENIGLMLKKHFKHSQFIVVSLKDGMFNNANVLFTTKFVDGMSTVSRKEISRSK